MATNVSIRVNGLPTDDPSAVPQPEPYLVVVNGLPVERVMWDGVSDYTPARGAQMVREAEWNGPAVPEPTLPPGVAERRTTEDRLDALVGNLRDDLRAFDTMTAQQRQASQRRALRGVLLLARVVRGDFNGTDE